MDLPYRVAQSHDGLGEAFVFESRAFRCVGLVEKIGSRWAASLRRDDRTYHRLPGDHPTRKAAAAALWDIYQMGA